MRIKRLLPLAAVLAMGTGLVACGDDDTDTGGTATEPAAGGQVIDITAVDFEFEGVPEPDGLEQGPVTVSLTNEGEEPHMVIFGKLNEGFSIEDAIKAEGEDGTIEDLGTITPVGPGEEAPSTISTEITEPGNYFLLCPLETKDKEFHYDLGQLYEYEVQ